MTRARVQSLAMVTTLLGVAMVVVGSFLPWARSGTRWRSSYHLLAVADRLGFTSGSLERVGVRLWPLVPLAAAVVVAAALHHRTTAAVVALIVGLYALGFAAAVTQAPLPGGIGLAVSGTGAMMAVAGGLVVLGTRPGARPDRQPQDTERKAVQS